MLEYVNTKIGSLNERRFSNGNIYPVTACPFGMAHFTVQTDGSSNWFYNPLSHAFEGIRLTHQPSPWVGDYGHMLFLPYSGELAKEANRRWSSYRPERAVVEPYRLQVDLQRYRVGVSLVPTVRGALIGIENRTGKQTGFALIPYGESSFTAAGNELTGYTDAQSVWDFKGLREYFYLRFSEAPVSVAEIENGGVALSFAGKNIDVAVSASFISAEQAKRNYRQELENVTPSSAEERVKREWEELLSRIVVSDEDPERKKTFYSCLYRTMLYPRIFHEFDEAGEPIHYNADTRKAEKGVFYTDNGFWDTYRTVYPLLSILMPERVREMAEGFINYAEETGWLPKWLSPGEFGLMPGTLVEAVIADLCVKGIVSGELRTRAYRALLKNAYASGAGTRHGRTGSEEYIKYGYVPNSFRESVNHTCDCAYGDFCIAQVARLEGDAVEAQRLLERSKSYKNLFDGASGFLRGRNEKGELKKSFDPFAWGGEYCEGSAWQNGFAVCHDTEGLAALYGGKDKLCMKLDELFSTAPVFEVGDYGEEIHEMSEMASVDFGQCAISNQPSFHIPWLYAALGERGKTEFWVEKIVKEAFSSGVDGFPGDEDNGTMAAWYVFACLGFYPLCPGKDEFVTGKPLFEKLTINGKQINKFSENLIRFCEIQKSAANDD